jgi:hypothetical protein
MWMQALFNSILPIGAIRKRVFAAARFILSVLFDVRGWPNATSDLHA